MSRTTRPLTKTDAQGKTLPSSGDWNTFRGEYSGTLLRYSGSARPGASEDESVWQIMRLTYDGSSNLTTIEWPVNANGAVSSDFEFNWTNRAAYIFA